MIYNTCSFYDVILLIAIFQFIFVSKCFRKITLKKIHIYKLLSVKYNDNRVYVVNVKLQMKVVLRDCTTFYAFIYFKKIIPSFSFEIMLFSSNI